MFAAPLTGWLGDRFRRKPLIIAGAVLWSLATLGTAWVHDYWTLYIRHALVGVGEATFGIFAPAVLADFYPERDRNRILSIFYLAIPVGAALGYLAGGQMGSCGAGVRRSLSAHSGAGDCGALWLDWARAGARRQRPRPATADREARFWGCSESGVSDGHLWAGDADVCHGRHFGVDAHVSAPLCGALGGQREPDGGRHHGGGRHCGNAGGRMDCAALAAHQHRALYLLSFWSVALTLPCGCWCSLGRARGPFPRCLCGVLSLPQHRAAERGHRELGFGAGARHGDFAQPVLHSCFGDTFSPQIIGAISDRSNLRIGLGATLIFLVISRWTIVRRMLPAD
jgi:MFS transporter, Spinster family, sphingosine-1-phosphate transporter